VGSVEGETGHGGNGVVSGRGKQEMMMANGWAIAPEARVRRATWQAYKVMQQEWGKVWERGAKGRRWKFGGGWVGKKGEGRRGEGDSEDDTPRTRLRNMMDRARAALAEPV